MKNNTLLNRVNQYVAETNSTLVGNRLKVSEHYKMVDGIRCVEVILEGNFIYKKRIELLCDHTCTILHAITLQDRNIRMLLKDKRKDSE